MPHLPPTAALRALAAAARHLSFTKAAEELNITQSAVSHQIRHIEELWEIELFERRPRRLELTPAGERLAGIVNVFLKDITEALDELRSDAGHAALRVEMLPSLAVKWLVPRLQHFRDEYPDIDVWIATHHNDERSLQRGDYDAVIRLGHGNYPGLASWTMMRDYVYPVARPRFLEEHGMPETPADLCKLPLLLKYSDIVSPGWEYWFEAAHVPREVYQPTLRDGIRYPDTNMAIQAAFEGLGVALARSAHVWEDLETGRLVRLFDVPCPSDVSVDFVCRNDRADKPAARAFREWLLRESERSQKIWDADESDHALTSKGKKGEGAAVKKAAPAAE